MKMEQQNNKVFSSSFRLLCWLATILLICYWIYLYTLDNDICIVDFKQYYDTPDHTFPKLSICLKNPFLYSRLRIENSTITPQLYSEFLAGKKYSTGLLKINYSAVTLDASQFVDRYWVEYRNGSSVTVSVNENMKMLILSYAGFWEDKFYNCYAVNVPDDKDISTFSMEMLSGIYPKNVRANGDMISLMHHRSHFMISGVTLKQDFSSRVSNDSYINRFIVKGTEMITRRNKKKSPCYEDWRNYDSMIMKEHAEMLGCTPPYFTATFNISKCSTKEEMANSALRLRFDDYGKHPPCHGMEKIYFTFEEQELGGTSWNRPGYFWIGIYVRDPKLKEIVQIKAIDLNGLIGYIGGYVGLILGYNILQMSDCIWNVANKCKDSLQKKTKVSLPF